MAIPSQVTILGLGLFGGGVGAARYFAARGARVIVTDLRDETALRESIAALQAFPITFRLGRHCEADFAGSEMVVVNPAVAPDAPALAMAQRSGAQLETATNLLLRLCPAPIAAVTGTHGKSTTVALLAEMMKAAGRRTWLGGNLGGSLLPQLEAMTPDDAVVIEVSSFQAQRLAWLGRSPHVAAVLNLTPNHMDRHADLAEYAAAKQQLIRYQRADDFALLPGDDPILREWAEVGKGEKIFCGAARSTPRGFAIDGSAVEVWRAGAGITFDLASLRLPGAHNRSNAAFAGAAAWLLGANREAIETGMAQFAGLPERLEFVREVGGVRFYNDSIATTPESAIAGIESFSAPVILIAGGSSKKHSFDALAQRIASRCKQVVLIGATADEIAAAIAGRGASVPVARADDLQHAVSTAAAVAEPGDIVLLSPACASFDMFRNFRERGRRFNSLVNRL